MYYQEISFIKNQQSLYECWSLFYGQLHLSLVNFEKMGIKSIGASFPNYHFCQNDQKTIANLGNQIRLFANQETLKIFVNDLKHRLDKQYPEWQDDLHFKSIKAVPSDCRFVRFSRHYVNELKKVAQDFAKHKNISIEEALAHCQTYKRQNVTYPFVRLKSLSSNKTFYLHIVKIPCESCVQGEFDSYGLSKTATVPEF